MRTIKKPGSRLIHASLCLVAIMAVACQTSGGQGPAGGDPERLTDKTQVRPARDATPKASRGAQPEVPPEAKLSAEVLALSALSAVPGRPTATSLTLNVLGDQDQEVYVEFGTSLDAIARKTATLRLAADSPVEMVLEGLEANHGYVYRLRTRIPGTDSFVTGPQGRFHTQRAPGSEYSFEVIGDSHPERPQQFNPELYAQNLKHAAADAPDFFITMGDDFSVDTLKSVTRNAVETIYHRQRLYLPLAGAPVFLVNGNHEQAAMTNLDGTADNVAVWAQNARNSLFSQPAPDGFYSGDITPVTHIGLLRDYYAWTWGDALFVVIDPYWHSPVPADNAFGGGEKSRDLWKSTIGDEQYAWLKATLEASTATFKFVFAHHVSGTGRGGIERTRFYEWGGEASNGKDEFKTKRPGWDEPIHQLMVSNKVTAFIQGHDHLFANQLLDGVAYITLAEPADPNYTLYNADAYTSGDVLPNSGRVRFTVGPDLVTVEYIREWLPGDGPDIQTPIPAYRFEIPAGGLPTAGIIDKSQATPGTLNQGSAAQARPKQVAATGVAPATPILPHGDLHAHTLLEFPGPTSVGLATAFLKDVEYHYEYGTDPARLDASTPRRSAPAGTVVRDTISNLKAGSTYNYRLAYTTRGSTDFAYSEISAFTTMKPVDAPFSFIIEADPHLDENSSGAMYTATLDRMAGGAPDFIIDLGDTSMVEKLASDEESYLARNQLVRSYWDDIGNQVPFYMVIGNHDGEHGWSVQKGKPSSDEAAEIRAHWLIDTRTASGDSYNVYSDTVYSYAWSDALFIVLDPFMAESRKPGDDGWDWTLGKAQYDWLAGVLSRSKASYRFVFIHNMLGGKGKDARGGAAWAGLYEWGGLDTEGNDGFTTRRPGWAMPLHDLFLQYHVDVVFHGHDHFYAMEKKDGMIYQLVPQPSLARAERLDPVELCDYGYIDGVFLPSPGYLRVSVNPESAEVEYIRGEDGTVAHSYSIKP